jgi:serine/threonine protein phosphatase PrpC
VTRRKNKGNKKMSEARVLPNPQAGEVSPPAVETRPQSPWHVVGAAVRGVSHERTDLPCQDAVDWRVLDDGTLLIAVADGAGSARFSDAGARLAVDAVLRRLIELMEGSGQPKNLQPPAGFPVDEIETGTQDDDAPAPEDVDPEMVWTVVMLDAFETARAEVLQMAEEAGESADKSGADRSSADKSVDKSGREYATTLSCVVADAERLVVAQIGDGAVVADQGEGLFAATRLQRGEYANETHFLTQDDALDQVVVDVFEQPAQLLAVMSDGLIRLALKMPSQEPHAPFFEPLFRYTKQVADNGNEDVLLASQQLATFLRSERVNARTDDDKSLVLAVRSIPEDPEAPAAGQDRGDT